jgi:hypothetical protein
MLDAWWRTLSVRLDSGPAALHRLPETVAHVAEALWMQALEEGRRRAHQELKTSATLSHQLEQNLEVRSHVLTLREGELDSRLRDRTIEDLNLRLRELTGLLRKEQATRELLSGQIASCNLPACRGLNHCEQLGQRENQRPQDKSQRQANAAHRSDPKQGSDGSDPPHLPVPEK